MTNHSASTVSRRNFLRLMATAGIAGGAVGLAGCAPQANSTTPTADTGSDAEAASWRTAPEPIADDAVAGTEQADVVVIGGGLSGVCTAASAIENGLSVIVLEMNDAPRMTGLDFGCVNPTIAKENGLELSDADTYRLVRDWVHMSANRVRPDIILSFVRESGPAIDWICDKATAWGCRPTLAAMRSNSDTYYNYIHPVEFPDGPLYDIAAGSYGVNDIIALLQKEIEENGGSYLTRTKAAQLVKNGDRVTAVIAQDADGVYRRYEAARGVVLACGDFGGNEEMMSDLTEFDLDSYSDPLDYVNVSTGNGSGHQMGLWAGGKMQFGTQPLMMLPMTYPYFYLRVNNLGQRYCNEDCDSVNMCINQAQQPHGTSWAIWDAKWRTEIPASLEFSGGMSWDQDFRELGSPWSAELEEAFLDSEVESGALQIADSLEELAELCALPLDELKATVERYNKLAQDGNDPDFGKRAELLTTISEPPFYALRMQNMMCVSVGGLDVDVNSQVLDENRSPIAGLYAVGNTAGGLFGVDYNEAPVPGISLGRCVTFGKLLGEHLATL
ncbi:FAD-dependent oxidoreductase [Adlercreutzia sp. R21]|uniref:FAD-dependent oxidoreductase n=1 Tax=Adlercreutzia wanghongyangiae TaxID=3111451 RepID=UPI002DBB7D26|nr:FAD-dependent oxidoreductase [Adlercreutzia sp. R21]MEC4185036.1 FAD-dependent oxidoreductase [Adlercreutzia sp. R21]